MSVPLRIAAPLFVLLLAGCSPQNLLSAATSGSSHTATITDDYYPMPAGSVTVPAGWKYAGAVLRVPGCHGNQLLTPQFTVGSPDGLTAVAALPGATWKSTTNAQLAHIMAQQKCPAVNLTTAADFLADIVVPNLHPGAVITKVGPGGATVQQAIKSAQAGAQAARFPTNVSGAAVRIEYQRGNQTIEEELSAVVSCSVFHSIAMFAAPASTTTTCGTFGITAVWAPKGHLDEFLSSSRYNGIVSSFKTDNTWLHRMVGDENARFQRATADFNRVCAQNLAVMKQQEDDLVKSSQAQNAARKDSTDHSIANANQAMNARSEIAHRMVNYSSDRMDYINPATGQKLNLDYNANHSWGSTDGRGVVLNGSSTYDPNGSVNAVQSSWVELVPAY
jgi:hypothetical protein